jgi:hypothetical protein
MAKLWVGTCRVLVVLGLVTRNLVTVELADMYLSRHCTIRANNHDFQVRTRMPVNVQQVETSSCTLNLSEQNVRGHPSTDAQRCLAGFPR